MNFAQINNGKLEVKIEELNKTFILENLDHWDEMMEELSTINGINLTCSSSIDFPEDETSNNAVILMCDWMRGNNVSGKNPDFGNGGWWG